MEVILPILVVALLIGGFVLAQHFEKKRRADLEGWARHQAFTFAPARDASFDTRYPMFGCLRQGTNRYAYNVMRGRHRDRPACCFDYHYETYSTDSKGRRRKHHHHFSAVVLETGLPCKPLLIRPENFFDKVGEFFGADDVDFESAQFSREFFVKCADRRFAFDVLHQATIEFLLGAPRYTVELAGPWILARRGGRMKAVDFSGALHVVDGILDRFPEYLLRDMKGAQG